MKVVCKELQKNKTWFYSSSWHFFLEAIKSPMRSWIKHAETKTYQSFFSLKVTNHIQLFPYVYWPDFKQRSFSFLLSRIVVFDFPIMLFAHLYIITRALIWCPVYYMLLIELETFQWDSNKIKSLWDYYTK